MVELGRVDQEVQASTEIRHAIGSVEHLATPSLMVFVPTANGIIAATTT